VVFIFSYNDSSLIDPILRDRIKEINVNPYSVTDKITITKKFLLDEICNSIGYDQSMISFSDSSIEYIIENYTNEAGVRELKRCIESIILKLNLDKITQNSNVSVVITNEIIHLILKKPDNLIRLTHNKPIIGIVNGLYATDNGKGGIIPIQIYGNYIQKSHPFSIKMTGNHGKIMKESIFYSFNTAMSFVKKEVRDTFYIKYPHGIHVHTPSGAIPKDGPSAGSAFTIAFLSIILNKQIKPDIAITGEIEPTGKITAIGGLLYKLNGAIKAGIKIVYIPKDNKQDYLKIMEDNLHISNQINIKLVENILEIASDAILDFSIDSIN
jgi:ATP-dependent Lon protease